MAAPPPPDPRVYLREAGVADEAIGALDSRIDQTVQATIETYSEAVSLDADGEIRATQAIQDAVHREIIEMAGRDPGTDVTTWFDRVHGDFADPEATSARSSVALVLGKLAMDPAAPDACSELANAAIARNYDDADDEESTHE